MFDWPIENLFKQLLIVLLTVTGTVCRQATNFIAKFLGVNSRCLNSLTIAGLRYPEYFFSPSVRNRSGSVFRCLIILNNPVYWREKNNKKPAYFPRLGEQSIFINRWAIHHLFLCIYICLTKNCSLTLAIPLYLWLLMSYLLCRFGIIPNYHPNIALGSISKQDVLCSIICFEY